MHIRAITLFSKAKNQIMTQLEKQIQASEKRIAKYEKNMQMYEARMSKKLELLQKQGYMATREDFQIQKTGKWKYDYDITVSEQVKQQVPFSIYMPVVENLQYKQENTDRLADEKETLNKLKEKDKTRTQIADEISEQNKVLAKHLGESLAPFKKHWMEDMTNYHREFYHRIHKALPNARVQYDELQKAIYDEKRKNGFRPSTLIKQLEYSRKAFGRILSAPPAAYPTEESYMNYMKPRLEDEYKNCLYVLADKCKPFQLDTEKVQVHHPRMAERGFDLLLTDGKDRVIDARMIWAAENSEYVSPHTRYIVTERTVKDNMDKNMKDMDNKWIEKIDWQAFKENLVAERKNEKLWALGSVGTDEEVHWKNHERLTDEIKAIDKGQYDLLLNFYDKSVFQDYLKPSGEKMGNSDKNALLMDALTDIAMHAGWKRLEFEDSKLRNQTIQEWAREFADNHANTDWEKEDYINLVDEFAEKKVNHWLNLHPLKPSYIDRISDIHVYSGLNARTFIRCKIDGEQQTAVQLSFADAVNFNDRTDRMTLAARYFKEALESNESQNRGPKR